MNRLQKKCLLGSVGFHLVLALTLIFGAAFKGKTDREPLPPLLTLLNLPADAKMTDDPTRGGGGGAPAPVQEPPPAVQKVERATPLETPPPEVVKDQPKEVPKPVQKIEPVVQEKPPVKPVEKPEVPIKREEKKNPVKEIPEPKAKEVSQTKTKTAPKTPPTNAAPRLVKVDLGKVITRSNADLEKQRQATEAATAAANAKAAHTAAEQRNRQIGKALEGFKTAVRSGSSGATVVDSPGQGGGGEFYVNYRQLIYSTYVNAWDPPDEMSDSEATAQAKIVVGRDGEIISHSLVKKSGSALLDKSVEAALRRVPRLPGFPEGSKDSQRTFLLNFNLKAKNQLG